MTSQRPTLTRTERRIFESCRDPAFVQAVNRAANIKCLEAIKSGKLRVAAPHPSSAGLEYAPRMDLINDPSKPTLTAVLEIPGMASSEISLHIVDGHLVILGERRPPYNVTKQSEDSSKDTTDHSVQAPKVTIPIQELRFGTFRRTIPIPPGLKESDVSASLTEGMLTLTWPKIPAAAARTRRPPSSSPPTSSAALQ